MILPQLLQRPGGSVVSGDRLGCCLGYGVNLGVFGQLEQWCVGKVGALGSMFEVAAD